MKWPEDAQFDRVRNERDLLKQAKLAGELIAIYQQRSVELARLRKQAINRVAAERGINFSAIAAQLGITRGRVTQIRNTAPPAEREFFGVGPVTVAVPLRDVPGRRLPMISSEDTRARDILTDLLQTLAFQFTRYDIPANGIWTPPPCDVVAICGPKSSRVTAQAITSDPFLTFEPDDSGRWTIRERHDGRTYESPLDDSSGDGWSDIAYFGRLALGDETLLVIAGVHALGSIGVADYLVKNLPELYAQVGTSRFSMVIGSRHTDDAVTESRALCPPRVHE